MFNIAKFFNNLLGLNNKPLIEYQYIQKVENPNMVNILKTIDGFTLVDRLGFAIRSYSRARDARRGALRLGYTLAA